MSNYPAGFTQGEHDRTFGDAPNQDRYGNEEDCALCHRAFVQDTFDRRFYFLDDVELYGFSSLSYSKSIDPFEAQGGWVCGAACYNDHAVNEDESIPNLPSTPCTRCGYARGAHGMISTVCPDGNGLLDESIPARPVLHLVKGRTA